MVLLYLVILEILINSLIQFHQDAFDWVWNELVPELQQERYLSRGITVQFLRDVYLATDAQWLAAELLFDFDGKLDYRN